MVWLVAATMPLMHNPTPEWFTNPVAYLHDPSAPVELEDWQHDWCALDDARAWMRGADHGFGSTPGKVVQSAMGAAWDVYEWGYDSYDVGDDVSDDHGRRWVNGFVAWRSVNGWHAFLTAELPDDGWDPRSWDFCLWDTCTFLLSESFLNLFGPAPTLAALMDQVATAGVEGFRMVPHYTLRPAVVGMIEGLRAVAGMVGEEWIPADHAAATEAVCDAQRARHGQRVALPVEPDRPVQVERAGYLPGYTAEKPASDYLLTRFRSLPVDEAGHVPVAALDWLNLGVDSDAPETVPHRRINAVLRADTTVGVRTTATSVDREAVLAAVDTLRISGRLRGGTAVGHTVTEGVERLVACLLLGIYFPCALYSDDDSNPPVTGAHYQF